MTRRFSPFHAAALASLALAGPAHAYTVEECVGDALATRTVIEGATTFLNARDQSNLADTATGVALKINKAKFYDALTTLSSMRTKVDNLVGAAKPKLGGAEGDAIKAEIDATATCVNGLLTQP